MKDRWMCPSCICHRIVIGLLALACLGILVAPEARATTLFAGEDCWVTNSGSSTVDLGTFPAGFFNCPPKSSLQFTPGPFAVAGVGPVNCPCAPPTFVWVNSHGSVVNPGDNHAVQQVPVPASGDTCVKRKNNVGLNPGVPSPVPIEIIDLHLRGVNPLVVPMNDATNCLYQVDITLDGGTQAEGSMTLTPGADPHSGSVNLGSLPVGFKVSYTPVSGCCSRPDQTGLSVTFSNTPGTYHLTGDFPSMTIVGTSVLVGVILVGMTLVLWKRRASVTA